MTLGKELAKGKRGRLLQMLVKCGFCAEVGIWRGDFAQLILEVPRPVESSIPGFSIRYCDRVLQRTLVADCVC